ncbi:MAG TPA: ornithine carbamoyltransferase [bacterium]|nr:ornithine carbamoyltransferase [bacterium]HPP30622.1 ornithine carbamoyltransferase [bacterium]
MKKDFLTGTELTGEDIYKIFDLTKKYKASRKKREYASILKNKTIGLIFNKPSTRTRVSFELAVEEMGGRSLYLSGDTIQISRGETIKDTASVLSRYLDGLVIRTYKQEEVEEYARWFTSPVINALTNFLHPCQAITDYFTIYEKKGTLNGIKILYIGDGNNVCNSLIIGADILGVDIMVATPEGYQPSKKILSLVKNKELVRIDEDPLKFISEADVIYTDTWVSMGDEKEAELRRQIFQKYQVNRKLLEGAKDDFLFMHCLPAHRGWEVTDDVIDSENSIVYQQAENRLHCQKALLHYLYE